MAEGLHWMALPPCPCGGRFLWLMGFEEVPWVAICYRCGLLADEYFRQREAKMLVEVLTAPASEAPVV